MVTQTMKDVFGATQPKHHGSSSKLAFDSKFKKVGKVYELKLDVKIIEGENGEDGDDGEVSGSVGLDKHMNGEVE